VDTFGHNPYPDNAAEPRWVQHGDPTTVGQGDLDRLLDALTDAFDGTRQPLPGEGRTTVWYLETGFQTTVSRTKRRFYSGEESDSHAVPPVAPDDAEPWVRDQAGQLRDALLLARCHGKAALRRVQGRRGARPVRPPRLRDGPGGGRRSAPARKASCVQPRYPVAVARPAGAARCATGCH